MGANTNPVPAGAGGGACRGFDFCRNNFHHPHTIAHARTDGAKELAGRLGAFPGIAHDLDNMSIHHMYGVFRRRQRVALGILGFEYCHQTALTVNAAWTVRLRLPDGRTCLQYTDVDTDAAYK